MAEFSYEIATRVPSSLSSYISYILSQDMPPYNIQTASFFSVPETGTVWWVGRQDALELLESDNTLVGTLPFTNTGVTSSSPSFQERERFGNLVRITMGGNANFFDVSTKIADPTLTFTPVPYGIYKNKHVYASSLSYSAPNVTFSIGFKPIFKHVSSFISSKVVTTNIDAPYGIRSISTSLAWDKNHFDTSVIYIIHQYLLLPVTGYNSTAPVYTNNPNAESRIHVIGVNIDDASSTINIVFEDDFPGQAWDDTTYEAFETIHASFCEPVVGATIDINEPYPSKLVIQTAYTLKTPSIPRERDNIFLYSLLIDPGYVAPTVRLVEERDCQRTFYLHSASIEGTFYTLYGCNSNEPVEGASSYIYAIDPDTGATNTSIELPMHLNANDGGWIPLWRLWDLPVVYNDQKFGFQTYEINVADPISFQESFLPDSCSTGYYNGTVTVLGGFPPYTLAADPTSTLPASLVFTDNGDGTGSLTGIPNESGIYSLVINVEDSQGNTYSSALPFEIYLSPNITNTTLPEALFNQDYSGQINVS